MKLRLDRDQFDEIFLQGDGFLIRTALRLLDCSTRQKHLRRLSSEMDFDIDAVLDQLEKTSAFSHSCRHCDLVSSLVNQSDVEEEKINPVVESSPIPPAVLPTPRPSVDELLLLDLDPLGNIENHQSDSSHEQEDKLERLKFDIQQLYASSVVVTRPTAQTPTLPDIIGQQEELSSASLPQAVEQLELEVRQEVLQHTLEQTSPSLLLPDLTTVTHVNHEDTTDTRLSHASTDEETNDDLSLLPVLQETNTSNTLIYQNEPDLLQHETPPSQVSLILHSVDSIVNASDAANMIVRVTVRASPP